MQATLICIFYGCFPTRTVGIQSIMLSYSVMLLDVMLYTSCVYAWPRSCNSMYPFMLLFPCLRWSANNSRMGGRGHFLWLLNHSWNGGMGAVVYSRGGRFIIYKEIYGCRRGETWGFTIRLSIFTILMIWILLAEVTFGTCWRSSTKVLCTQLKFPFNCTLYIAKFGMYLSTSTN